MRGTAWGGAGPEKVGSRLDRLGGATDLKTVTSASGNAGGGSKIQAKKRNGVRLMGNQEYEVLKAGRKA